MENEEFIKVDKKVFLNMIEELQLMRESLEFMSEPEIMEGYKRAKKQIEERDFGDWNEL